MPHSEPSDNTLLASLPDADFRRLAECGSIVSSGQGNVLTEADDEVRNVDFLLSGMVSLVVVMKTGNAIETATIGREGGVGLMAGLGPYVSPVRAIVQISMTAMRIPAPVFRTLAADSAAIFDMCVRFNEVLLTQARITAACNALHPVEARFCRWLLQTSDRAGSGAVVLTQEFISEMLGVRRTSVTDVALKLQAAGLINYNRGTIRIIDRPAVENAACECYERLRRAAPANVVINPSI